MFRTIVFPALLFILVTGVSAAMPSSPPVFSTAPRGVWNDVSPQRAEPARSDTVYFGGDDGTGTAFVGGVWDWDTIVSDPLQGWVDRDMTLDPALYFYRVKADSFTVHGDPCTPIFTGTTWEIWCGVHENDADQRDFVAGMGYGNNMCQKAQSPMYPISSGNSVTVGFKYFEDSEVTFDYTYAYINCYDALGALLNNGNFEVTRLDGRHGTYDAPSTWGPGVTNYSQLPAGTAQVQLEFRFDSDGGWSDEDGSWATDCGPFAADDVTFNIGTSNHAYDFESGAQGWTFQRCPGKGAFMQVWPQSIWSQWLEQAGVLCSCPISGNVLGFADPNYPGDLPGYPVLCHQQAFSGVVERGSYQPPAYNGVVVRMAGYTYLKQAAGTFARGGWTIYPYVTDVNPTPHWSPRTGQDVWYSTGDTPYCAYGRGLFGIDLTHPPDGTSIPPTWDKMKFIFEITTNCKSFALPSTVCTQEGVTYASPLIDRCQVGLTHAPDAPSITPETGMLYMDGFGQRFPTYLEPEDVGNANVSYDISMNYFDWNDWNGDTASVAGPVVNNTSPHRWIARVCFKIDRKGPRQDAISGYLAWKQRIAYAGNPEQDYVCVQMDSVQITQGPYKNKFLTFFHESEPGFDHTHPDYTRYQEILPDSIWTPGTRLLYKYQARWIDGTEYGEIGPWEFEILPHMELTGGPYSVQWPCVLYIDRFNRGAEDYIVQMFEELGLAYDKYDALDGGSSYDTSIKRTFGGEHYNPGSWGNNGMTTEQALGYRLILFSLGTLGAACCEPGDWDLLEQWLASTDCGLGDIRRALIMDGDEIAAALNDPSEYGDPALLHNVLGTRYVAGSYGTYNQDDAYCVYLEPAPGFAFAPAAPGVSLYGSGCPNEFNYNVLGVQSGVPNTVGNLRYYSYLGTGTAPYVNYAQVVRTNVVPRQANWKSVVDGFSLHHLSERGCAGEACSSDSACVVAGEVDLMGPELAWLQAGGLPFIKWTYWCASSAVGDDPETHVSGPVDFLYVPRPNPFRGTVTVRFSLAAPTHVNISIFDVSGRLVRTLVDGPGAAGEQTATWDGADNRGHRAGGGIFWIKMRAESGYTSSLRMIRLE